MLPVEQIASRIVSVRGGRVVVDSDLAALYGVETRVLNQAVRRNSRRFPADLAFRLTSAEREEVITNCDHLKNLKYSAALPLAFTEHGALMAASVLNSRRAVEVGLYVVRAFVQMREAIGAHREISRRLDELEKRVGAQDGAIVGIVRALRELTQPPPQRSRPIGFVQGD
jgi:ORF6N domain